MEERINLFDEDTVKTINNLGFNFDMGIPNCYLNTSDYGVHIKIHQFGNEIWILYYHPIYKLCPISFSETCMKGNDFLKTFKKGLCKALEMSIQILNNLDANSDDIESIYEMKSTVNKIFQSYLMLI